MASSRITETDYVNYSTYGFVPRDFVPINGARSVVPSSGNIIDDLCYFFKFHQSLKLCVIEKSQAKITLVKNNRELVIFIYGNGKTGSVDLLGDQALMRNLDFHLTYDQLNSRHELNDMVDLLYSLQNVFYSYV